MRRGGGLRTGGSRPGERSISWYDDLHRDTRGGQERRSFPDSCGTYSVTGPGETRRWKTGATMKTIRLSLLLAVLCTMALGAGAARGEEPESRRPNVLWLTCEDMGPHIGPYGDRYATTPNLDRFAARALRYQNAWSNAPV